MYEYTKNDYVYRGGKDYGPPIREIKTVSEQEAKKWDNLDKQIREMERYR